MRKLKCSLSDMVPYIQEFNHVIVVCCTKVVSSKFWVSEVMVPLRSAFNVAWKVILDPSANWGSFVKA